MNNLSSTLHIYGLEHGYWNSYAEFFTRSKEDRQMVFNIMVEETIGIHPIADMMIKVSELEDFADKKRKEYEHLI